MFSKFSNQRHDVALQHKKRIEIAQNIEFPENVLREDTINNLLIAHSQAVGCPKEFILFPLLTAVAYCMGIKTEIRVNPEWIEPAILWFVVAARKGEKKTAGLNRVKDCLAELEREQQQAWRSKHKEESTKEMPQILVEYFSFEELHEVLKRSNGSVIGMFDEFLTLLQQLDLFKGSSSTVDRKLLLSLNGGSKWSRNFRKMEPSNLAKTHVNFCGMVQPKFVTKLLDEDDADGLMDRLLFVCPKEVVYYSKDYKTPMPENTPKISEILKTIQEHHKRAVVYTFDEGGLETFHEVHDTLVF